MESSGTPSSVVPRLRISRHSPKYDDGLDTPQAGPCRTPFMTDMGSHNENDDGGDTQSTPRLPIKLIPSESTSAMQSATPTETPAARLRALLSRVPNSPSNFREFPATPAPASDRDSDIEPPQSGTTPSIARESLKDLFTRALRDPGDTPQKDRRRRNSIDVSEVDASPRVQKERAKNKGKRRSLSNEEADKSSSTCHKYNIQTMRFKQSTGSGTSLRSSQAATFDILRERLTNSQTQLINQNAPFDDRMYIHWLHSLRTLNDS